MNPENTYDHPNFLNLENEAHHWLLIDPMLHVRRLNRILKRREIQQAYALAAEGYDCIERFDCLERSDYSRYPKWKAEPSVGADLLVPADAERTDWRWDLPPGRPPLFHQYVCARACHWLAVPNLLVAQALFPELTWVVLSSEFHSTVACIDEHLLFDLNYAQTALNVTAADAIEMLLKHEGSITIEDADQVGHSERTLAAIRFFELADNAPMAEKEMLAGFRSLLIDEAEEEIAVDSIPLAEPLLAAVI